VSVDAHDPRIALFLFILSLESLESPFPQRIDPRRRPANSKNNRCQINYVRDASLQIFYLP
jgi:hypothetical protein